MTAARRLEVYLETYTVGECFGTSCRIRSTDDGRIVEFTIVRPFGADGAAYADGEALALKRGWSVHDTSDDKHVSDVSGMVEDGND